MPLSYSLCEYNIPLKGVLLGMCFVFRLPSIVESLFCCFSGALRTSMLGVFIQYFLCKYPTTYKILEVNKIRL